MEIDEKGLKVVLEHLDLAKKVDNIRKFIVESNKIEGIVKPLRKEEQDAYMNFLREPKMTIEAIQRLLKVVQPDAKLRDKYGLDVVVGNHIPPKGAPEVRNRLDGLLKLIDDEGLNLYQWHRLYQDLHPWTDGNGRSGRAIWLWQKNGECPIGFLHQWYYDSLREARVK